MVTSHVWLLRSVAVAALMMPGIALGQEQGRSSAPHQAQPVSESSINEIVVTARKRSESVQDVPITVTVASGAMLQSKGITDIASLTAIGSGITIQRTGNNIVAPKLRGLGTNNGTAEVFEQSVGMFIDGTYAGRGVEFNQAMFDLERVEIIKGTQAALLAKNTSLGAISMVTRKPGDDFSFNMLASYDFALGSRLFEAGVDVPVSDTLKVRFSGQSNLQGGWIRNVVTGNDVLRSNSLAGRVVAVWKPTPDFDATLLYQAYRYNGLGVPFEQVNDAYGNGAKRAVAVGYTQFETKLDYRTGLGDPAFGDTQDRINGQRAIATLNYDLNGYVLTSVSAYSQYFQARRWDADAFPGADTKADPITQGSKQYSQELRITSPAEKPFNFVLGGFFMHEDWSYLRDAVSTAVLPGALHETFDLGTRALSAFGQANYQITPSLTLTTGVRVTDEKRSATFLRQTTAPGPLVTVVFPPYPLTSLSKSSTTFDGSAGIQFKPTNDMMFYLSVSKGTKGGAYLNSPTSPALADYGNEIAYTYEGGAKLSFGRSYLNITAFNTDLNHLQQAIFRGGKWVLFIQDVRSRGAEVEAGYQVADGLRLGASVTYAHTRNRSDGTHALNAPDWSGNIDMYYEKPVSDDLHFAGNLNLEFRSRVLFAPESDSIGYGTTTTAITPTGDPYGKLNGRLAIGRDDKRWEIALVARNILNRKNLNYAVAAPLVAGLIDGTPGLPRTVSLQFLFRM